ncbi:MAG: alpha/beta fold hydrolase [Anaerolineae bacterium]
MNKKLQLGLGIAGSVALAFTTALPFLIPIPKLKGTRSPAELGDLESHFARVNDVTIHYKQAGQGSPVYLLLHGYAANSRSWRDIKTQIARRGTAIAVDRPGSGLTHLAAKVSHGVNPYSVPAQANLFWALLDQLHVEKVVLVGHSAGATVALHMVSTRPERVSSLVLVDAAIYTLGPRLGWVQPLLHSRWIYRMGVLFSRLLSFRARKFEPRAWHDPARIPADFTERYGKAQNVHDWDVNMWESTRALHYANPETLLAGLDMPVLVITGDDDRVVPIRDARRLAQAIPHASLQIIADCGHLPQQECPDAFISALDAFFGHSVAVPA